MQVDDLARAHAPGVVQEGERGPLDPAVAPCVAPGLVAPAQLDGQDAERGEGLVLAERGELSRADVLERTVMRMLADSKIERFLDWLVFSKIDQQKHRPNGPE